MEKTLESKEIPIELLQSKFTVCSEQFVADVHEDDNLGTKLKVRTIPTLKLQTKIHKSNDKDAVLGKNDTECVAFLSLLKKSGQDTDNADIIMQNSYHSTSTNNTDICVLEANESHYSCKDDEFTMLHAPITEDNTIEESTEVLLVQSEYNKKSGGTTFSGTDSDVEILMSEEIIDSDWSAGVGTLEETNHSSKCIECNVKRHSYADSNELSFGDPIKHQESTDQDISIEDFSRSSMLACEKLDRNELLKIIQEQSARIRNLQLTLERYKTAQQSLFDHVETLKKEFQDETP